MNIKYWVIFTFTLTLLIGKTVTAQLPLTDQINRLNQDLQRAVDNQDINKARKITDLLIKELINYRQQLSGDTDYSSQTSNLENTNKKPLKSQNSFQFGRELVLETSAAYSNNSTICVLGEIRNNSRSPISNNIYAIAYFFNDQNQYLGSKAQHLNPQDILPNQTVNFIIETSQSKQITATTVKLRFQGTNSERKFYLYPTIKSKVLLPVSNSDYNCYK